MDPVTISALIALPAAAVLAPLLSASLARFVRIPLVVFEIVLGILFGPSFFGWVEPTEFTTLGGSRAGDVVLPGRQRDRLRRIEGRPLNRSMSAG